VSRKPSPPSTARRKDEYRRDRQEAAAYVVSLNLKRRYLDESQRAYGGVKDREQDANFQVDRKAAANAADGVRRLMPR